MSGVLTRLNLRPEERRLVVVVGVVVFGVLNLWLVWPHFRDWARLQAALDKSRATLLSYQKEVGNIPKYQEKLKYLESQGSAVLPAEQALQLARTVRDQAAQSGVMIVQTTPLPHTGVNTNQFFEEQAIRISVNSNETNLVNFLYAIGSGNSMIRVRDLDLRPDPGSGRTRLVGGMTLVASYQRQVPAKIEAAKTTPATNGLRPVQPKRKVTPANPPGKPEPRRPEPRRPESSPAQRRSSTTRKP
ncbi:MAG: hypothetical protein KGS61_05320 [Verrucomicrobia bacterium]|nr:hypothetical protein [Verrucomicrobiota bacterium]